MPDEQDPLRRALVHTDGAGNRRHHEAPGSEPEPFR
jgi:hypothetical protein